MVQIAVNLFKKIFATHMKYKKKSDINLFINKNRNNKIELNASIVRILGIKI